MKEGDIKKLGKLLNQSHNSLKNLYEISCKEIDTLVELAISHPDCLGSRMTGGGFGGCTIAIVKTSAKQNFKEYVSNAYEKVIGYKPTCYDAEIADGIIVQKV
jgi:galactokinase